MALSYAARADGDRLEAFWTQAMRLRDLLKFDFYFADSDGVPRSTSPMRWPGTRTGRRTSPRAATQIDAMLRAKRPLIAQRHAATVLRGLRDRRRRAARRARRDRREGTDDEGARRRQPVRRAEPGAQQRGGVRAAVRDRPPGGRRPASAGAGGRPPASDAPRSATSFATCCATWTRSSRSPASSSMPARWSGARCARRPSSPRGRSVSRRAGHTLDA